MLSTSAPWLMRLRRLRDRRPEPDLARRIAGATPRYPFMPLPLKWRGDNRSSMQDVRIPELDGIRGIACTMVVLVHVFVGPWVVGMDQAAIAPIHYAII